MLKVLLKNLQKSLRYGGIISYQNMHRTILGFTCVFTQCVKHLDDQDQYWTGSDMTLFNRLFTVRPLNVYKHQNFL